MFKKVNSNKNGVIEYAIDSVEDLDKLPRKETDNTVYAILNKDGKRLVYLYSKAEKDYILINGDLEGINKEINSINEQLDSKVNYCNFIDLLLNNKITKIKLIGDSITWGADADGYNEPSSGRLIYDSYYEMNHNCECWANSFRNYIKNKNSSIDFFNAGISGHSMKRCSQDKVKWIGTNNDVIFLNLGVNDFSGSESINKFKEYMIDVVEYAIANSNYLFICTTPPVVKENNIGKNGHSIEQINEVIRVVAKSYNVPLLDINTIAINIANNMKVNFEIGSYFLDDLTHPSTLGHSIMWLAYQECLGFKNKQTDFMCLSGAIDAIGDSVTSIKYCGDFPTGFTLDSTPITHPDVFKEDFIYYINVGYSDAVRFLTPGSETGIVIYTNTNSKFSTFDGFLTQQFFADSGKSYSRIYDTNGKWTKWFRHFNYEFNDKNLTLDSGWSKSSFTPSFIKRRENTVSIQICATGNVTTTGNQKIMTLDELYRPSSNCLVSVMITNQDKSYRGYVMTTGEIYINGVPIQDNVQINVFGTYAI